MSKITDTEAETMIIRARTALLLDDPFYGTLITNLGMIEDLTIPTLCVSRNSIRYNPAYIRTLSPGQIKAAQAHEVGHCVYDTFGRRAHRDPRGWNIATDYAINENLKNDGFELGEGWLINPAYFGMSAEHIYEMIPKDQNGNFPGTGESGGAQDDVDEVPGPDDQDMTATDWKMAVVQAANEARSQGKLSANMQRFVDDVISAQVDWRALFMRFFTERSKDDYSWTRPNRRMMQYNLFMPSLYSESMGAAAVFIDTSGSIDQHTLNTFGAEVRAAHAASRPSAMYVIYCDSQINHVDEFGPNDELHFEMHGGGGTDFRPPFQYIDDHGIQPVVGLYLTDLYGPEPEQGPGYPFMWCCTTDKIGSFGETLKIKV